MGMTMLTFSFFNMAEFMSVRRKKEYHDRRENLPNYRNMFRFDEISVEWMADQILGPSNQRRGGALSSKQKFETVLRYFGDPGFQTGVGIDIGIHQTTVSRVRFKSLHFHLKFLKNILLTGFERSFAKNCE